MKELYKHTGVSADTPRIFWVVFHAKHGKIRKSTFYAKKYGDEKVNRIRGIVSKNLSVIASCLIFFHSDTKFRIIELLVNTDFLQYLGDFSSLDSVSDLSHRVERIGIIFDGISDKKYRAMITDSNNSFDTFNLGIVGIDEANTPLANPFEDDYIISDVELEQWQNL